MKYTGALLGIGICGVGFLTSCGNAGIGWSGKNIPANAVYFTTGVSESPQNLNALDMDTFKTTPMSSFKDNKEMSLFYNDGEKQYYVVRYLQSLNKGPTVLTKFNLENSVDWERNNISVNIFGLLNNFDGKSMIMYGNQKGQLQVISNKGVVDSHSVSLSLTNSPRISEEDLHIIGATYSLKNELFVISDGIKKDTQEARQARIYKLSKDMVTITNAFDIPNCKNISDNPSGFKPINRYTFLVVCNPQYNKNINDTISLVIGDVTSGVPSFKVLKSVQSEDGIIKGYSVKGISNDKKWAFVEELRDIYLGLVTARYWLNLETAETKQIKNYGSHFFFDKTTGYYIFACSSVGIDICKDKTFAKVKGDEFLQDRVSEEKDINYENTFTGFSTIFY